MSVLPSVETPSYSPTMQSTDAMWSMNSSLSRGGGRGGVGSEGVESLLGSDGGGGGGGSSTTPHDEGAYSMQRYFQTFVQDIYQGFRSLHPAFQVGLVLVLLFAAFKLLQ